jgi:hypothetical protein
MQSTHFDNGRVITVYHNDQVLTFNREDNEKVFLQVRELYKVGDYEAIFKLVLTVENINLKYADSELSISKEGIVTINGDILPASLSKVIVALYKEDAPIDCFIQFWNKLNQNPSNKAVNRLYDFVDKHNITILPDGNLLLYRVVRRTEQPEVFIDIHTGTIKQAIGETISMTRNKVDDDSTVGCSRGLHCAAWGYTNYYGNAYSGKDAVVNVSVNPANVVAIPDEMNMSKIRVCEFTILEENTNLTEIRQAYYNQQLEEFSCDEDDYNEDYWDDAEDEDY